MSAVIDRAVIQFVQQDCWDIGCTSWRP